MKIDRLIGIIMTLLQQEKATAPELAQQFEVSRRTINRDIEDICKAGVPLVTIQGRGGTDFTPVFRYVEELRRNKELNDLKALLYFTDGDGVYPRQPTEYQTAFVFLHKNNHMDHVPPWAVTLALEGPAGCTNDSGQVRGQTI